MKNVYEVLKERGFIKQVTHEGLRGTAGQGEGHLLYRV